jgi:serine/threonine protein kinase
MKHVQYPTIVDFRGAYKKNEDLLWVVMELMDGPCVAQILDIFDVFRMNEHQIARVTHDVSFFIFSNRVEKNIHLQFSCVHFFFF